MNFISRPVELEDLYLSIQKVSGFTVEQLLDMFMAGYEMAAPKYEAIPQLMPEDIGPDKKEAPTMKVTYKGYTGWPLELKRRVCIDPKADDRYDLKLWDPDVSALISFTGVKFEDMKFYGGAVTFGG